MIDCDKSSCLRSSVVPTPLRQNSTRRWDRERLLSPTGIAIFPLSGECANHSFSPCVHIASLSDLNRTFGRRDLARNDQNFRRTGISGATAAGIRTRPCGDLEQFTRIRARLVLRFPPPTHWSCNPSAFLEVEEGSSNEYCDGSYSCVNLP